MALIKCPECEKEISNKVKSCPNCGYPMIEEGEAYATEPQQVELTSVKIKTKPTLKKNASILIISLVTIIIFIFGYKTVSENKAEQIYKQSYNEYIDNLYLVQLSMFNGAAKAESICNLVSQVWKNTIYKEKSYKTDDYTRPNGYFVSDFNIAITNFYDDSSTKNKIGDIKSNQDRVQELMKTLKSTPEGLDKCYETVLGLYTAYKGFTDLAISPTGSLQSYNESVNKRTSDFMDSYDKLKTQIPDKLE